MRLPFVLFALTVLAPIARAGEPTRIDATDSSAGHMHHLFLKATARSTLCEKKPKLCHDPDQLLDDDVGTAWCEGVPGDGKGETITFKLGKPEPIAGFEIVPLFGKSFALAEANGRVTELRVDTDAGSYDIGIDDLVPVVKKQNGVKENTHDCGDETCLSRDARIAMARDVTLPKPVTTSKIVFTLVDVVPGAKHHDTCISTLEIYLPD